MLPGYARVGTDDLDPALQRQALREAGRRRLFEEKLPGAQRDRPKLARLLDQVRDEDVLVVTRLGRPRRWRPTGWCSGRKLLEEGKPVREVARLLETHRVILHRELAEAAAGLVGPAKLTPARPPDDLASTGCWHSTAAFAASWRASPSSAKGSPLETIPLEGAGQPWSTMSGGVDR